MQPRIEVIGAMMVLGHAVSAIADEDCNWNKEQLERYSAMCASVDGCRSKNQMTAIVRKSCGTHDGANASAQSGVPLPYSAGHCVQGRMLFISAFTASGNA